MKNLLKNFNLSVALACVVAVPGLFVPAESAQAKGTASEKSSAPIDENLEELDLVEMINSVPLDSESADLIRKYQEKIGRQYLYEKHYNNKTASNVETYRNKEVLLVTIPASALFAPNAVDVSRDAKKMLDPLKPFLKDPDMFRVLVVMHTDNTGSQRYRDELTEDRSTAIYDWFADQGLDTSYLFPFALGDDQPLVINNSMNNREKNRRLEVYIIPGKKLLEYAKKGEPVLKKYINSIIPGLR